MCCVVLWFDPFKVYNFCLTKWLLKTIMNLWHAQDCFGDLTDLKFRLLPYKMITENSRNMWHNRIPMTCFGDFIHLDPEVIVCLDVESRLLPYKGLLLLLSPLLNVDVLKIHIYKMQTFTKIIFLWKLKSSGFQRF